MKTLMPGVTLLLLLAFAPAVLANKADDKAAATNAVSEARAMIRSAERSGADSMATVELKMARDLLNSAQSNMDNREWLDAEYAARKSQRDAEVADSKTQALKAEYALAELQSVVDTLKSELQRQGETRMNTFIPYKTAGLVLLGALFLNACATAPTVDPRVTALQYKLETLESNPELAARGGEALKTARAAVQLASQPAKRVTEQEISYRIYVADRLVETAEMRARARLAEDRSKDLVREHDRLVLEARTLEADRARQQAAQARQSAAEALAQRERALQEAADAQKLRDEAQLAQALAMDSQYSAETAAEAARTDAENARLAAADETEKARLARTEAEVARTETENARLTAADEAEKARLARIEAEAARAEMASMRGRLSELEAKQTERGLLITLGDVLFEFNKSELKTGGQRNLQPLADVLKERTNQLVIIEGHTDSIGNHAYNMNLSEQRAEAVEQYLVAQGVAVSRIDVKGLGPDFPVADNASSEGRQLNRRVEVILPNLK